MSELKDDQMGVGGAVVDTDPSKVLGLGTNLRGLAMNLALSHS